MNRRILSECIQFLLILLFVYTGVSKLIEQDNLRMVLEKMPLTNVIAGPLAILIPIAEIAIATLFFFQQTVRIGMLVSAILLSVFTIYLVSMILFLPHLPCSCGGVIASMTWKQHIVFNVFFTALSVIGYTQARPPSHQTLLLQ